MSERFLRETERYMATSRLQLVFNTDCKSTLGMGSFCLAYTHVRRLTETLIIIDGIFKATSTIVVGREGALP